MMTDWHTSPREQQKSARTAQLNQNCFMQKFRCFVSCTRTSQLRASHGRAVLVALFFLSRMLNVPFFNEKAQLPSIWNFVFSPFIKTKQKPLECLDCTCKRITHFHRWRTDSLSAFIITCFMRSLNSKWLSRHFLEKEGNVILFLFVSFVLFYE